MYLIQTDFNVEDLKMNAQVTHPLRLTACAFAVVALFAGPAFATPPANTNYSIIVDGTIAVIGVTAPTGPVVISNNVTLTGNTELFRDSSRTTLLIGSTRNTVTGEFNANGGTLGFTLAPNATLGNTPSYSSANFNVKDGVGSGQLTAGSLKLAGDERINATLTGTLRNGATYNLISSGIAIFTATVDTNNNQVKYNQNESNGLITDNSFVINSSVAVDTVNGTKLVYTAQRGNDEYIAKSNTAGHFSNGAALALGTIAAQGRQLGDLITAINLIDIDSNGYGNNLTNLAVQMKRLAPVANNAYAMTALGSSDLMLSAVDDRLASLRGDVPSMKTVQRETGWFSGYSNSGKQTGFDNYDGYKSSTTGAAFGFDRAMPNGWIGVAFSAGRSVIEQIDFRLGDKANMNHYQASIFGAREFGAAYIDGTLSAGRYELSGQRATAAGRTADAQFNMYSMDLKGSAGYRFKLKDGKSVITPMVGLEVSALNQPGYTETGAGDLGLQMDQKTVQRLRSKVGVRFNTESRFADKPSYTTVYATYNHDSGMSNMDIQSSFSGTTDSQYTSFTTTAAELQRNALQLGAGVTLALSKQNSLQLRYDIEHRQSFNSQAVQVKGIWKF
jgi:outer membrane autotransporter protein